MSLQESSGHIVFGQSVPTSAHINWDWENPNAKHTKMGESYTYIHFQTLPINFWVQTHKHRKKCYRLDDLLPKRPSGNPDLSGSGDFEVMIPPPAPLSLSSGHGDFRGVRKRNRSLYIPSRETYPQKWHFEDDFPFPQVGYVNCLEGISSYITWYVDRRWWKCVCVWRGKKNPSWNLNLGDIHTDVSENRGTPKSSILRGFSIYKPSILG